MIILWSNQVKYLGMLKNKNLTFGNHIKEIVSRASYRRGSLNSVINKSSPISTKIKLNINVLYIKSLITYAGSAWAPCISSTNWAKFKAVQNIYFRIIAK